jgi:hypothetical protein
MMTGTRSQDEDCLSYRFDRRRDNSSDIPFRELAVAAPLTCGQYNPADLATTIAITQAGR